MQKCLEFHYPFPPYSYNNAYGGKRRYLKSCAKQFKEDVKRLTRDKIELDFKTEALAAEYTFTLKKIVKKDGELYQKRHDYDGFIKLFQDAFFDALGIDDSNIINATVYKRQGTPSIRAKVWTIPLEEIYN